MKDKLDAVLLVGNDKKIWENCMIAAFTAAQKRDLNFFVDRLAVCEHYEVPFIFFPAEAELSATALIILLSWFSLVLTGMPFFGVHEGYKFFDIVNVCI